MSDVREKHAGISLFNVMFALKEIWGNNSTTNRVLKNY